MVAQTPQNDLVSSAAVFDRAACRLLDVFFFDPYQLGFAILKVGTVS